MAPEALRDAQTNDGKTKVKLARSSDVWSLGCILYQLVYGHAPFSALSLYQKLQAIMNPKHKIKFLSVPGVGQGEVDASGWGCERAKSVFIFSWFLVVNI